MTVILWLGMRSAYMSMASMTCSTLALWIRTRTRTRIRGSCLDPDPYPIPSKISGSAQLYLIVAISPLMSRPRFCLGGYICNHFREESLLHIIDVSRDQYYS